MGVLTVIANVIYIGAAALMVFAILLQEGKGGGLSALGGTQAESAFGATNPIRRMTVVLAVLFFLLAGFLSFMGSRKRVTFGKEKAETTESTDEAEGAHDHEEEAGEEGGEEGVKDGVEEGAEEGAEKAGASDASAAGSENSAEKEPEKKPEAAGAEAGEAGPGEARPGDEPSEDEAKE